MSNFSYTTNPGYVDLVSDMVSAINVHFIKMDWGDYENPITELTQIYCMQFSEFYPIIGIAVIFTILRYAFELIICKPLLNRLKLNNKSEAKKFPESFWKSSAYFFLWAYCVYMLTKKYDYFNQPHKIWDDWSMCMNIPDDIKLLYFVECGFYFHSIYATLYMDEKRKDFLVMLIHHVLTLALIIVSYATRFHKVGILVLFVHDVTDILLELTKCHVYLKNRHGKHYPINELLSNIGFVAFAVSWFIFRLYWFPLKVLYSTGVWTAHRAYHRKARLYTFFNSLLWFLMMLDLYWFYFIVLFLYKVATGQLKELNDTREFDDEKKKRESIANKISKKDK